MAALCDRDKAWVARISVPEERLNFDVELAATAALDMARRYADADTSFLSAGEDLLTALSGRISKERVCTFAPDGTAVWRLSGEAAPVKGKAGKSRREKAPARPLATVGKVALGLILSAILLAAGAVGSFYWQAYRSRAAAHRYAEPVPVWRWRGARTGIQRNMTRSLRCCGNRIRMSSAG